jgi:hypothetical protein
MGQVPFPSGGSNVSRNNDRIANVTNKVLYITEETVKNEFRRSPSKETTYEQAVRRYLGRSKKYGVTIPVTGQINLIL